MWRDARSTLAEEYVVFHDDNYGQGHLNQSVLPTAVSLTF